MPTASPRPVSVSVDTAGEMIGVSRSAVYRMLGRGELASIHIGRRRVVTVASIDKLVQGAPD